MGFENGPGRGSEMYTATLIRYALYQLHAGNRQTDKSARLFKERNAWAAGWYLIRKNYYPTGFQNPASYFEYAKLCLATYDRFYNDSRFAGGLRTY